MPSVFAFTDNVIGQAQTTLFSAFGCFSLLVLASFEGPPRSRLKAYLALSGVGAALISLGTVCSRSPVAGASVMAVVGFTILFAGLINRYFAAGGFAALLSFILAVNVPAAPSAIAVRLEGWGLASAAAIAAAMLLWPPRPAQRALAYDDRRRNRSLESARAPQPRGEGDAHLVSRSGRLHQTFRARPTARVQ